MIIECDKCGTKFNLDASLIKEEGIKARCSRCRHIFRVFPPEPEFNEEAETLPVKKEELEATVALDSSPVAEQLAMASGETDQSGDFADAFDESLEAVEKFEAVSPGELGDLMAEEPEEPGEAAPEEPVIEEAAEEPPEPEPPAAPVSPPRAARSRRSPVLLIVLVALLVLIGGAVAVFFWAPQFIPDSLSRFKPVKKQVAADIGVRRLSFKGVTGSFVDSNDARRLFVVQGMVKNDYPKPRSFILVKGTILDDQGHPVRMKMAYAGNPMSEAVIRTLTSARIAQAMKNRAGKGNSNVNIPPGKQVPFTIVFENLPENLGEFTVEAVQSSPGR